VGLTLVGRLGDIFGRRYFLIGGQTLGFIGALICATAKNIPAVIGGTVLVGLAGAVQLTFTFVVAELVPNKYRAKVDAFLFMSIIPLSSMGPAFGKSLHLLATVPSDKMNSSTVSVQYKAELEVGAQTFAN